QRHPRFDRSAIIQRDANSLETVAKEGADRAPVEQGPGRHAPLALVRVHRAHSDARKTQAGDVDKMSAGQRAMIIDEGDSPDIDPPAPGLSDMPDRSGG